MTFQELRVGQDEILWKMRFCALIGTALHFELRFEMDHVLMLVGGDASCTTEGSEFFSEVTPSTSACA